MDVVERYLRNVRTYLPGGREEDVVAELRENIRAQLEDREERLGRPLSEDERIGVLRAHGHPLLVAGQYRSDGRRLVLGREVIGPALFPFFRIAILAAAAITALVLAFGAVAAMLGHAGPVPFFRTAVYYLSLQIGLAVAVFAGLQAWLRRTAPTWDPRKLPASNPSPPSPVALRVQAAVGLLATWIFLWFWTRFPDPLVLAGSSLSDLRPGPAWELLHLGVTVSTLLGLVTPALTLLRPAWRRYRWIVSLFASGAFIAFGTVSLWSGAWVVPAFVPPETEAVELAVGINKGFIFGLGLALFFTALATVFEVTLGAWRAFRRRPGDEA